MADAEARREARRRKILQNSENRLNRVLGNPLSTENEPAKDLDGIPSFGLQEDSSGNASSSSSFLGRASPAEDAKDRMSNSPEPADHTESQASTAGVRQRAHRTTPADNQPAQKLSAEAHGSEKSLPGSSTLGNGLAGTPGRETSTVSSHPDPVQVLDLMRCGGCLLTAFLTRWALSFGLGILFLELVLVPFILLEGSLYYFQTTHMKDIQLPHRNSMMAYALLLSGMKPEVITKYNTIMGYISAVMEDFALYLFTFLLSHAVIA